MQDMLIFLLVTVIFFIAQQHAIKVYFSMVQEDGALDRAFGMADKLANLYGSTNKWKRSLGDMLGNCEMCFTYWASLFVFFLYYGFCKLVLNFWVTDNLHEWWKIGIANISWYFAFHFAGAGISFLALIAYKSKNKNNGV